MATFMIVFGILAGIAAMAILTSRQIDRMAEAEWEEAEDLRPELCRHAVTDGVCRFECGRCPWHVEEETEDLTDDR